MVICLCITFEVIWTNENSDRPTRLENFQLCCMGKWAGHSFAHQYDMAAATQMYGDFLHSRNSCI